MTFNGMKVHGFTSVGWAVLITAFGWILPIALPVLANGLSVLSGLWVIGASYVLTRRIGLQRWQALLVPVLLASTWDFAFYMGNGLETLLFTAAVVWSMTHVLEPDARRTLHSRRLPVVLSLTILVRPEGALIAGVVIAYLAWMSRNVRATLRCCGAMVGLLLPVAVAVRLYYGSWLPNTFAAKAGAGLSNIAWGVTYVRNFAAGEWLVLAALGIVLLLNARRLERFVWPFAAVVALLLADGVLRGGDNMVGARVFLPMMPLLYALLVWGLQRVPARVFVGVVCLLVAFNIVNYNVGTVYGGTWGVSVKTQVENWRQWYAARKDFAFHLKDTLPSDAVVALTAAGVVPYYTDFKTIDMLGLNNRYIAQHGKRDRSLGYGHQAGHGEYVMSQRPDVIFFGGVGPRQGQLFVSGREMLEHPEFMHDYESRLIGEFRGRELYAHFRVAPEGSEETP